MLTFESTEDHDCLELHGDKKGLLKLAKIFPYFSSAIESGPIDRSG